jgi:hypothetical protein
MARPNPRAAPVTKETWPLRSNLGNSVKAPTLRDKEFNTAALRIPIYGIDAKRVKFKNPALSPSADRHEPKTGHPARKQKIQRFRPLKLARPRPPIFTGFAE